MTNKEKIIQYNIQINNLKILLKVTDYKAVKYAEGELTEQEYAETRSKRRAWRAEINALEAEIESIKIL